MSNILELAHLLYERIFWKRVFRRDQGRLKVEIVRAVSELTLDKPFDRCFQEDLKIARRNLKKLRAYLDGLKPEKTREHLRMVAGRLKINLEQIAAANIAAGRLAQRYQKITAANADLIRRSAEIPGPELHRACDQLAHKIKHSLQAAQQSKKPE